MEIRTEDRAVTTDGTIETTQFRIKTNAKAFKILIDRLYSDKIKAVCRELMTNALDAHIVNGNRDQPFEITVPNEYDHFFAVRDFGCSMTHEQIMTLYSTVFESTKDKNNDAVGQLGLGSKSPFAYSDAFSVTCWLHGEKRVYSAYIGADSMPRIDLMLREASDEPQGVEVRIPTREEDEDDFLDRVQSLAYGFDVLPVVKGKYGFSIKPLTPTFEGEGWRMYNTHANIANRLQARQGCVLYPITANAINRYGLAAGASDLMSTPMILDFPIGQIDFTPSREEISYDEATKRNIERRLEEVLNEFVENYKAKLASCQTEVEARRFALGVVNSFGYSQSDLKTRLRNITWRARRVAADYIEVELPTKDVGKLHFTYYQSDWFVPNRRKKDTLYSRTNAGRVDPERTTILWYSPTQNLKRIKERLMKFSVSADWKGTQHVLLVSCEDKNSPAFKRLLVATGRPVDRVFDLEKYVPDKIVRGQSARSKVSVKVTNGTHKLAAVDVDPTQGGFYIRLDRTTLPNHLDAYDVRRMRNNARDLGLIGKDDEVYVIPSSILDRTVKQGPWCDFLSFLKPLISDDSDLVKDCMTKFSAIRMIDDGPKDVRNLYKRAREAGRLAAFANTGIADAMGTFRDVDAIGKSFDADAYNQINALRKNLAMGDVPLVEARDLRKRLWLHKDALDAYPMLKAIANADVFNYTTDKDVLEYVTQIDSASSAVTLSAIAA